MFNKEIMKGSWHWHKSETSLVDESIKRSILGIHHITYISIRDPFKKHIAAVPELLNIANEANRMLLELQETGTIYIDDLKMRLEKLKEKLK